MDEQHLNINEKQYIRFVSKQIALELTELALRDAILSFSRSTSTPEEKEEKEEKEDQEDQETRESKESTMTNEGGSKSKK